MLRGKVNYIILKFTRRIRILFILIFPTSSAGEHFERQLKDFGCKQLQRTSPALRDGNNAGTMAAGSLIPNSNAIN